MSIRRLTRIHGTLGAIKRSEMAALASAITAASVARAEARELRQRSRQLGSTETAADMQIQAQWQRRLEDRARAAEAAAARSEAEAEAMRKRLARAAGREAAISGIIARARRADRDRAYRKEEDEIRAMPGGHQEPVSSPPESSAGTE